MDRYCPECNSTMTPSLVGYLCTDCGNVQRFYTMSGTQLQSTSIPTPKSLGSLDDRREDKIPKLDENNNNIDQESISEKNTVKKTLKRLMIPELAPPHDHGEPAKVMSKSNVSESTNIFGNYDDLLETSSGESDATAPAVKEEMPPSPTIAEIQDVKNTNTSKRLPAWVWIISGIIIFLSTALILLLIVVT